MVGKALTFSGLSVHLGASLKGLYSHAYIRGTNCRVVGSVCTCGEVALAPGVLQWRDTGSVEGQARKTRRET